jgi:hypothetical protein
VPNRYHQKLTAVEHRLDGVLGSSRAYTGVALLRYCGPVDLYGTSPGLLGGLAPNDRRAIRFHPVVYGAATLMRITMKMADDALSMRVVTDPPACGAGLGEVRSALDDVVNGRDLGLAGIHTDIGEDWQECGTEALELGFRFPDVEHLDLTVGFHGEVVQAAGR